MFGYFLMKNLKMTASRTRAAIYQDKGTSLMRLVKSFQALLSCIIKELLIKAPYSTIGCHLQATRKKSALIHIYFNIRALQEEKVFQAH